MIWADLKEHRVLLSAQNGFRGLSSSLGPGSDSPFSLGDLFLPGRVRRASLKGVLEAMDVDGGWRVSLQKRGLRS